MVMNRIRVFSCPMDASTIDETTNLIGARIEGKIFTQHVVVNVAKIVNMQTDQKLADSVCACDVINIDGMGVVWAARMLGHDIPERVAGIDLFEKLVELATCRGYPIYLLGAKEEIVSAVASKLAAKFPGLKIGGYHHGYFWSNEEAVVEDIRKSGARMLFVAITSPKKEQFIDKWRDRLGVDFAMGVGGTFDVIAGKVQRAPLWMQKSGFEWLFRVLQEPGRMWKRYFRTNILFAGMLLRELIFNKQI
jgi:N-acetylglucosaminyldiphosphoundecaprenol N-acetyl-beta-D-mannosaminyltransferase